MINAILPMYKIHESASVWVLKKKSIGMQYAIVHTIAVLKYSIIVSLGKKKSI